MNFGPALLFHLAYLLPGMLLALALGLKPILLRADGGQWIPFLAASYLLGFVMHGAMYFTLAERWFREPRREYFHDHDQRGMLAQVAEALAQLGVDWPRAGTQYDHRLPTNGYWIFEFCRAYAAEHGDRQLWTRLSYQWEMVRLCLTLLPVGVLGGVWRLTFRLELEPMFGLGDVTVGFGLLTAAAAAWYQLHERAKAYTRDVWLSVVVIQKAGKRGGRPPE